MSFILGLDLGQTTDFSALVVLERPQTTGSEKPTYALRHLQRWHLGTAYTQIVAEVAELAHSPFLKGSPVVVDQTGIGRPVVDLMRQGKRSVWSEPVTITGGHVETVSEDGSYHVPKKVLVSCLQLILQSRRLNVARSLPEASLLVRELQQFQVKITEAANETFGALGQGQHDDLVIALALACWLAEKNVGGPFEVSEDRSWRSPLADAPRGVFLTDEDGRPWER
jgi:hypothetical protein